MDIQAVGNAVPTKDVTIHVHNILSYLLVVCYKIIRGKPLIHEVQELYVYMCIHICLWGDYVHE